METAVFGAGCFWCVEAVFQNLKGASSVLPGYAGGHKENPTYEEVSSGTTGHAEVTKIEFDPSIIKFSDLLNVLFATHDPTTMNRQGNDIGEQYRSAIFYTISEQQRVAQNYIQQLTAAHTFSAPIVTQLVPLQEFYPAEEHHQNYLALHPYQPYIVFNDMPKLEQLRKQFPTLYQ